MFSNNFALKSTLWTLAQFLAHSRHSNIDRMRKTSERVNQDHTIRIVRNEGVCRKYVLILSKMLNNWWYYPLDAIDASCL